MTLGVVLSSQGWAATWTANRRAQKQAPVPCVCCGASWHRKPFLRPSSPDRVCLSSPGGNCVFHFRSESGLWTQMTVPLCALGRSVAVSRMPQPDPDSLPSKDSAALELPPVVCGPGKRRPMIYLPARTLPCHRGLRGGTRSYRCGSPRRSQCFLWSSLANRLVHYRTQGLCKCTIK